MLKTNVAPVPVVTVARCASFEACTWTLASPKISPRWRGLSMSGTPTRSSLARRRGKVEIRGLLRDSRDNPWSVAERAAHVALRRARVSGWVANHHVRVRERSCFLDIAFRGRKIAFEIEGFEFHSSRAAIAADCLRHNALTRAGWTIYRVGAQLVLNEPDAFVELVREVIRGD